MTTFPMLPSPVVPVMAAQREALQQWERERAARQDASISSASNDITPATPPPIYLHRFSPSNKSLISTRAPSCTSTVVTSDPPTYAHYNNSSNVLKTTSEPAVFEVAVPTARESGGGFRRIRIYVKWRGTYIAVLIFAILLFLALLILAVCWLKDDEGNA